MMFFRVANAELTEIITIMDNGRPIMGQCLLESIQWFHGKRPCFPSMSLANGLFPSKHFRKENDSILPSLFWQFFQASLEA
jgi:hypothetical protein